MDFLGKLVAWFVSIFIVVVCGSLIALLVFGIYAAVQHAAHTEYAITSQDGKTFIVPTYCTPEHAGGRVRFTDPTTGLYREVMAVRIEQRERAE